MSSFPSSNETRIWRMAGGDGTRRGLYPGNVELSPGKPRAWPVVGAVQASVVFDTVGRAFVADMSGAVQAFSREGELVWRAHLPGGISATPAVHPAMPRLFVGTHTGAVFALGTEGGRQLWRVEIPTSADPRILSDLLYEPQSDAVILSSWGGRFHALDAGSGKSRNSWDAGFFPYSAATAAKDGSIYCLRSVDKLGVELVRVTSSGEEKVLDRVPPDQRGARRTLVAAAPVLDEVRGVVYFVVNRERGSLMRAWSLGSSSLLWSQPLPNAVQATPALRSDGVIVVPDMAGLVQILGLDGASRFRTELDTDYLLAGAVSEAGGTTFVGDPAGVVHAIDGRGSDKRVFEAPRSIQARPSFDAEGNLYVPATDHHVYVFGTS